MNVGHAHAAVFADAAQVVAAEIDEHDVLGALFLVALQLVGEALIFFLGASARPRAGDRMRHRMAAFDAHQHLGRGADDGPAAHADEEHVGRRIDVAQRAIHRERVDAHSAREALRQHDLVDVARGDVLFRLADDGLERGLREVGFERQRLAGRGRVAATARARARASRNSILAQAN